MRAYALCGWLVNSAELIRAANSNCNLSSSYSNSNNHNGNNNGVGESEELIVGIKAAKVSQDRCAGDKASEREKARQGTSSSAAAATSTSYSKSGEGSAATAASSTENKMVMDVLDYIMAEANVVGSGGLATRVKEEEDQADEGRSNISTPSPIEVVGDDDDKDEVVAAVEEDEPLKTPVTAASTDFKFTFPTITPSASPPPPPTLPSSPPAAASAAAASSSSSKRKRKASSSSSSGRIHAKSAVTTVSGKENKRVVGRISWLLLVLLPPQPLLCTSVRRHNKQPVTC